MGKLILILLAVVLSSFGVSNSALYNGLIAYYPLNEKGGKIAFNATRNTQGVAPASLSASTEFTPQGCIFNAATFASKIDCGKPSSFNLSASPMTVSVWVKVNAITKYGYMVCDDNAPESANQVILYINNTNTIGFGWINSGLQITFSTQTITANKWFHFVGVKSGSTGAWTRTLYWNGKLEVTASAGASNPAAQSSAGNMGIGAPVAYIPGVAIAVDGVMKNVMIWNRALSATEVRQLYVEQYNK